jgi:hypothetical protein
MWFRGQQVPWYDRHILNLNRNGQLSEWISMGMERYK